jgi:hypothetical protein
MRSFKRLICAISGHEEYVHFEKNRMYLQCVTCGYESPGWTIEGRLPVLPFRSNVADDSQPTTHRTVRTVTREPIQKSA